MTAIPEEVLGLRVEVVRSIRRTASLYIVGSDLQVRIPEHLEDERGWRPREWCNSPGTPTPA